MRAVVLEQPGPPESLRVASLPDPSPGDGLLVAVEAVGLNPVDWKTAATGVPTWSYPHVLGLDVVGTVVEAGPSAADLVVPGARIVWHGDLRQPGGYAERAVADPEVVAVVPDGVDAVTAAALPTPALTALDAVGRRLHVGEGDQVLVNGAAGGVGTFAVQLAVQAGGRVVSTCSERDVDRVTALGAEAAVDYRSPDLLDRLRVLAPLGYDAVVDCASAESATSALGLLRYAGRLAAVVDRADVSAVPPFTLAPTVSEVALGAAYSHGDVAHRRWLANGLTDLLRMVAERRLELPPLEVVDLAGIPQGLARMKDRRTHHKVVADLRTG